MLNRSLSALIALVKHIWFFPLISNLFFFSLKREKGQFIICSSFSKFDKDSTQICVTGIRGVEYSYFWEQIELVLKTLQSLDCSDFRCLW